jgi:hypothetical protein
MAVAAPMMSRIAPERRRIHQHGQQPAPIELAVDQQPAMIE